MDISATVETIRRAKSAHIRWRTFAQALVGGVAVGDDQVPLSHHDCTFGKWYYGDGQKLAHLPSFKSIETTHQQLHDTYSIIFGYLFGNQRNLWAKLFGTKASTINRQKAEAELDKLNEISTQLLSLLDQLESEVKQQG